MAVSSLSRRRASDERDPSQIDDIAAAERREVRKRITPFSIDDILSKCDQASGRSLANSMHDVGAKCMTAPELACHCAGPDLRLWASDLYTRWLDNLNRLYTASALQPFFVAANPPSGAHEPFLVAEAAQTYKKLNHWAAKSRSRKATSFRSAFRRPSDQNRSAPPQIPDSDEAGLENGDRFASSDSKSECDDTGERRCEDDDVTQGTNQKVSSMSPIHALERLACTTFKGMEEKQSTLHAVAIGRQVRVKRRKCRTAFTSFQLSVLEQRFSCHKYLTPADRDQIAQALGLTAPQVITWFQNRRAKLKRDLEELRKDIKTVQ